MGDSINFMMAAAGFNFRKLMVKLKENALSFYFRSKELPCLKTIDLFYPKIFQYPEAKWYF